MKIKDVRPANFLYFKTRTTVNELFQFLSVGQRLFREAVNNELTIVGPVHWHYHDFNGDASKPFDLEIALPIAQPPTEYDGEFHVKRTSSFQCIAEQHDGSWESIPDTYRKLIDFASDKGLKPAGTNREIYIFFDAASPEGNSTEIQLGIL
jgi:effector-binding domain-containing protein